MIASGLIALGAAGGAMAQDTSAQPQAQQPPEQPSEQPGPFRGRGGPQGPDWRQRMLQNDRGTASADEELAHLVKNLDLTPDQAAKIRPILQAHHDRILNLLETAPASLTRPEFTAQLHQISPETHDQVNALLTDRQRELVKQLRTPGRR